MAQPELLNPSAVVGDRVHQICALGETTSAASNSVQILPTQASQVSVSGPD